MPFLKKSDIPLDKCWLRACAYGFEKSALNFIYDYLTERTQRTKVDGEYRKKRTLRYGVPRFNFRTSLIQFVH